MDGDFVVEGDVIDRCVDGGVVVIVFVVVFFMVEGSLEIRVGEVEVFLDVDKEVVVDFSGVVVVLVFEEDFWLGLVEEDLGSDDWGGWEEEEVVVFVDEEDIVDFFFDDVDIVFDDDDDEDDKDVGDDVFFVVKFGDMGGGFLNEFIGRYLLDDVWLFCRMIFIIWIGLKWFGFIFWFIDSRVKSVVIVVKKFVIMYVKFEKLKIICVWFFLVR